MLPADPRYQTLAGLNVPCPSLKSREQFVGKRSRAAALVKALYAATLILLSCAEPSYAQNAPEMREILARLERVEKDNQALKEQVSTLLARLASLTATTVSETAPATDGVEATDTRINQERLSIDQNRVEELAETKVESSQKFPIRLTGMALFNAYVNGRANGESLNPTIASLTSGDATGGATLRQTIIGLEFDGPRALAGAKVSGSLNMDFFGGSVLPVNHLFRLRTALINLDWTDTSISVGQTKPLISARDPVSLAQVGIPALTGAGNLWLWQPQVRLEHRFHIGRDNGIRSQLGVVQTQILDTAIEPGPYVPAEHQRDHSRPGLEGRIEFWRRWRDAGRLEIAGGFHSNRNRIDLLPFPSNIYSVDWLFRPIEKIEFSGMFFRGRDVDALGALRQGFTMLRTGNALSVHSNGGWAQLRFPITLRLAFDIYGGQQHDRAADLIATDVSRNQAYFANLIYRVAPNVIVSLEGGQIRTTYVGIGNRLNDHYDLAIAYLF